jgi:hypothetical protein
MELVPHPMQGHKRLTVTANNMTRNEDGYNLQEVTASLRKLQQVTLGYRKLPDGVP